MKTSGLFSWQFHTYIILEVPAGNVPYLQNNIWETLKVEYLSTHKKNENPQICVVNI